MEELDTEVKGDPESFTATCQWLREASANVQQVEDDYHKARGESESGWLGEAGEAFRALVGQGAQMAGDTVQAISGACSAMEIHADDLRTVEARMQQARDVAAEGGLSIHGFKIRPPGPAPAAPTPAPENPTPQQRTDHAAATAAQGDYTKKVKAYNDAAGIVAEAKKKESDSQNVVVRSLSSVLDPAKLSLTLGDVSTGVAGTVTANASKFKAIAENVKSPELPAKLANNTTMSAAGRFQAAEMAAERSTAKVSALVQAYPTRIAAALDKNTPYWAKQALDTKVIPNKVPTPTNWLLKGATKTGKSLPAVGLVFAGAGVYYDIDNGKDPAKAVTSGGASFVTGAVAGAAIGGPVGVVAGAVIGIGVGLAVDEGWSLFE